MADHACSCVAASDAQPVRLHISFSEEKKARHAVNCVTQDYKKDGVT